MAQTYTIRDLCDRFNVREHTVLGWIHNGELKGLNVGTALGKKKPRWRITAVALAAFEAMRESSPPPPRTRRRRRKPNDIIEFIK